MFINPYFNFSGPTIKTTFGSREPVSLLFRTPVIRNSRLHHFSSIYPVLSCLSISPFFFPRSPAPLYPDSTSSSGSSTPTTPQPSYTPEPAPPPLPLQSKISRMIELLYTPPTHFPSLFGSLLLSLDDLKPYFPRHLLFPVQRCSTCLYLTNQLRHSHEPCPDCPINPLPDLQDHVLAYRAHHVELLL